MSEDMRSAASATLPQRHYYGKYRGFVVDNADPLGRGRLIVSVPSVLGAESSNWALPCLPFGGLADQGAYLIPETGAQIWVEFEEGNLANPIWTGSFWQTDTDPPAEVADPGPAAKAIKTAGGHLLLFDDTEDEGQVILRHASDAELVLEADGSLALTDSAGATLTLDAEAGEITLADSNGNSLVMGSSGTTVTDSNGNTIEMAASGITVEGAQIVVSGNQVLLGGQGGEGIIKGQSFLQMFMTHIHPTGVGPSGPPVPQGEMSTLSLAVKTT